jgi:hypothetical protein
VAKIAAFAVLVPMSPAQQRGPCLRKRSVVVAIASPLHNLEPKQSLCAQINVTLQCISLRVFAVDDFLRLPDDGGSREFQHRGGLLIVSSDPCVSLGEASRNSPRSRQ